MNKQRKPKGKRGILSFNTSYVFLSSSLPSGMSRPCCQELYTVYRLHVTWSVTLSIGVMASFPPLKRFSTFPVTSASPHRTQKTTWWQCLSLYRGKCWNVCVCVYGGLVTRRTASGVFKKRPARRARPSPRWEWGNLAWPVSMYIRPSHGWLDAPWVAHHGQYCTGDWTHRMG